MRRIWQVAAIVTFATMAVNVPVLAYAQEQTADVPVPATGVSVPTADVSAPAAVSAPTVEDIVLLKKAVDAFQKNAFTLISDVKVKATGSGFVVLLSESIKVSGRFPGVFRSEVTLFEEDGKTPAAKFQVIGNGANVYTYRPGTKQYAVQTVAAFQQDFALPSIGVLCGLIASADDWGGDDAPLDADTVQTFLAALKTSGMILESGAGESGRRVFSVRTIAEGANSFRVVGTVDAQTGDFVTMEMNGKEGGMKITVTETVRSMVKLPSFVNAGFTPPVGTKKIPKLSVWPF